MLPYILVGPPSTTSAGRSVEVRGRIKVSPRLVIAPGRDGPTYGELFGERELMDQRLVARVFSFRYALAGAVWRARTSRSGATSATRPATSSGCWTSWRSARSSTPA